MSDDMAPAWCPSPERIARSRLTAFTEWLAREQGRAFTDYESLWRWSITEPQEFWAAAWEFLGLRVHRPWTQVMSADPMPHTRWFVGAELNFVDQVFAHRGLAGAALVYDSEAKGQGELSWPELERQVAALAASLKRLGVGPGDRVVAYLPNVPEAVVGFLATASLGAIWSVSAPDLGPVSVVDRFRQVEPKVLIACDGYRFGGRPFDRREAVEGILAQLPSLAGIVWVPLLDRAMLTADQRRAAAVFVMERSHRRRCAAGGAARRGRPSPMDTLLIRHQRAAKSHRARPCRDDRQRSNDPGPAQRYRRG